jgi:hypothetical protein
MPNPDQDKWLAKIGVTSALKRAKTPAAGAPQRITFSEDEVAPIVVSRVATKPTSPQAIAFSENDVTPIVATRPATAAKTRAVKSPAAEGESHAEKPETDAGFGGEFLKDLAKTGAQELAEKGLAAIAKATEEATGFAAKIGEVAEAGHTALEGLGKVASVAEAGKAGWEIGTGLDEAVVQGHKAEGATKIVAGGASLGVTIAEVAAAASETAAAASTGAAAVATAGVAAAGVAAGGSILLAKETAEAAIKGEETPIDVADKFYGTHFGDIAGWVKGDYSKDKKKE